MTATTRSGRASWMPGARPSGLPSPYTPPSSARGVCQTLAAYVGALLLTWEVTVATDMKDVLPPTVLTKVELTWCWSAVLAVWTVLLCFGCKVDKVPAAMNKPLPEFLWSTVARRVVLLACRVGLGWALSRSTLGTAWRLFLGASVPSSMWAWRTPLGPLASTRDRFRRACLLGYTNNTIAVPLLRFLDVCLGLVTVVNTAANPRKVAPPSKALLSVLSLELAMVIVDMAALLGSADGYIVWPLVPTRGPLTIAWGCFVGVVACSLVGLCVHVSGVHHHHRENISGI